MIEEVNNYFDEFDFDVRKSKDARFMDQKVTPDVLCIIADCVLNFTAGRDVEFTKDDIWNDNYFNANVKAIFNKPDATNDTTRREYDKFISQPLRMLAYSRVLTMRKERNKNLYHIDNQKILEFIAMKERNSYLFLYHYLIKVLSDSNELRYFEEFKVKCIDGSSNNTTLRNLKVRFQRFIIGNTAINKTTEVNRIFPKILNIYACENNIQGTVKGKLSANQFYYTDLMYNKPNWRDVAKNKNISRNEAIEEHEALIISQNEAYSDYQVQKAMKMIRNMYVESEIRDQWANGDATQVHHIFPKSEFPQLAHYLENLIKLTPTQHYTKAHPSNKTDAINKDYQLVCLLAKSDSIENSLRKGEFVYRKESFVYVLNMGLSEAFEVGLSFREIKQELSRVYNSI
ncbi:hypothetical protein IBE48_01375 [Francisella philomiragia]|uniref:Type II R-M system restriction endonuclease n=1 Tax=Francisella philomiragia TaxID=28110 RepID=A0AAW3D9Z3_9GAMM|nr:hypothetical protein [Francisella philomiragia]KFJ42180.1 putative type II R-M system restriction endonuclease [Francisella philomiragia]MBK2254589.1 hypothetical protein [Francisella philomiragia]MBK2273054.1 hypothetical protein [Francisella philomiragia]MBK2276895.1 hypothetical protein [Francisella philomiragia]MBK2280607.1 hypothetical protein [Francisella philomiragia]